MTKCYFCGRQIKELPYTCRRCGEKFCSDHRLPENHYCRGYPRHYEKKSKKRISRRTKRKILKVFGVLAIIVGLALFYPQISSLISPLGDSFYFSDTKTGDQGFKASDIPLIGDIIDPSESFGDAPKLHNYPYYSGGRRSLSFTTYGGLNDYFSKESHTYYSDFVDEVVLELVEDSYQDEYMAPLLMQIQKTSNSPDAQARIAISMVQHMPYGGDWDLYNWYYPYETLHNNQGICSDKSLLLGYLLNRLGYDVVLFEFSDHMAVGVKCDAQYDFQNSGYAFIETTSPTILTYIPEDYVGGFTITSDVEIIHLRGGTRSMDVSGEYRDAQEMKRLESMGPVLDEYNYARWQALSQKYDLLHE